MDPNAVNPNNPHDPNQGRQPPNPNNNDQRGIGVAEAYLPIAELVEDNDDDVDVGVGADVASNVSDAIAAVTSTSRVPLLRTRRST